MSKKEIKSKPKTNYSQITNRIWIGNMESSRDIEFLTKNNIQSILNCTPDIKNIVKGVEYSRIPVEDDLRDIDINRMTKYLPYAVELIYKTTLLEKKNILVHCWAGMQRSVISVCAFLVKYSNKTPKEAMSFVLKRRPEAFHWGTSFNFEDSLIEYYNTLLCNKVN
jgi:protein-tyrosine phosphatase